MEKEQFLALLEKYKSNKVTQEEWNLLREHVQKATYQELLNLDFDQLLAIRQLHPSWTPEKEDRIWEQISVRRKMKRLPVIYRWMAAATIAGMIGLVWYWLTPLKPDVYITKAGERRTIVLPDSSVVMLNVSSKLSVLPGYDKHRNVTLEGEAWFQVKHTPGNHFLLHTRDADIADLGTTFNVRAYSNEQKTEAILIEGSIAVTPKNTGARKQYVLEPMQKLVLSPKSGNVPVNRLAHANISVALDTLPAKGTAEPLPEIAWTENKLVFRNESLEQVAKKLTAWYGTEVQLENRNLGSVVITGSFKMESLEATLKIMMAAVPDLHYRKEGEKIKLY